jgi:diguanylate cyclase (GGDEF)-like protein
MQRQQANGAGSNASSGDKAHNDRLEGLLSDDVLTLDLVSAVAGDRPLTQAEALLLERRKSSLGDRLYTDILYAITHQHFEPDIAKTLWRDIVRHKYEMSDALKRNIRVVVAALDYLSNITGDIASTTLISEDHIADIVDVSLRDGLTGLFNHTFFYRKVDLELKRAATYGTPVSVMMIDIDDFKAFNDLHGHQAGDAALAMVGSVIQAETRDADTCCRYGGEEFAVVLPSTDGSEAMGLAERLRQAIRAKFAGKRRITISIGVACAKRTSAYTPQSFVKEADDALYEAKVAGKDRIAGRV